MPAQAMKVRCRYYKPSLSLPPHPVPTTAPPNGFDPVDHQICQHGGSADLPRPKTLSIRSSAIGEARQHHRYGTTNWWNIYRLRPLVETGRALTGVHHGKLRDKNTIRVHGRQKRGILTALVVAAANLQVHESANSPP